MVLWSPRNHFLLFTESRIQRQKRNQNHTPEEVGEENIKSAVTMPPHTDQFKINREDSQATLPLVSALDSALLFWQRRKTHQNGSPGFVPLVGGSFEDVKPRSAGDVTASDKWALSAALGSLLIIAWLHTNLTGQFSPLLPSHTTTTFIWLLVFRVPRFHQDWKPGGHKRLGQIEKCFHLSLLFISPGGHQYFTPICNNCSKVITSLSQEITLESVSSLQLQGARTGAKASRLVSHQIKDKPTGWQCSQELHEHQH